MGCAGSKSAPVVEGATTDVVKNGLNGTLVQKVEDIAKDVKETVTEGKLGTLIFTLAALFGLLLHICHRAE